MLTNSLSSALLSNDLKDELAGVITPEEFQGISETLESISALGGEQGDRVKHAFAVGYNKQFQVLTGFSGAALLASLFLINRHPVTARDVVKERSQESQGNSNEPATQAESKTARAT